MKKLTTVSLFVFWAVVTAILVAGLVLYDKTKNIVSSSNKNLNIIDSTIPIGQKVILDMTEIAKHNNSADCWILINGKVYNITDYFGSHPGGNSAMSATCGKDATAAYNTKDPYATQGETGRGHSSRAKSLLSDYYLGDLNQAIQ